MRNFQLKVTEDRILQIILILKLSIQALLHSFLYFNSSAFTLLSWINNSNLSAVLTAKLDNLPSSSVWMRERYCSNMWKEGSCQKVLLDQLKKIQSLFRTVRHSPLAKQANRIHVPQRQQISIAEMMPSTAKPSKDKQHEGKEDKQIKCDSIQINKAPHVSQSADNEDIKELIADLVRKSKKGLIILRQSSSLRTSQDQPEPQEPVSQQNTYSFPQNRLSFSYEVKTS